MKKTGMMLALAGPQLIALATPALGQLHPKPKEGITECVEDAGYKLVVAGPIGPWRRSYSDTGGTGYSDNAPLAACGAAVNAQPLSCVTKDGGSTDPANCQGDAVRVYEASSGGRSVVTSYTSPMAYYSVAYADLGICQSNRGVWKTSHPTSAGQCGTVTVPVTVQCVNVDTLLALDESQCDPAQRPAATTTIDDKSGCAPPPGEETPPPTTDIPTSVDHVDDPVPAGPPAHLLTGACVKTSSGGGRIACAGDDAQVRGASYHVPTSGELCSGRRIGTDLYPDGQVDKSPKNWTDVPTLDARIPAGCAVSWRSGYSTTSGGGTSNTTYWVTHYYSGRPTGIPAQIYIGK